MNSHKKYRYSQLSQEAEEVYKELTGEMAVMVDICNEILSLVKDQEWEYGMTKYLNRIEAKVKLIKEKCV